MIITHVPGGFKIEDRSGYSSWTPEERVQFREAISSREIGGFDERKLPQNHPFYKSKDRQGEFMAAYIDEVNIFIGNSGKSKRIVGDKAWDKVLDAMS